MKRIITLSILVTCVSLAKAQWLPQNPTTYIYYNTGNVGINTNFPDPADALDVRGSASFGDAHDPYSYSTLQLVRPADQGDDRFHMSFIRGGNHVTGIGYARNSNLFGIWSGRSNTTGVPTLSFLDDNVGINIANPTFKLHVNGTAAFGDAYDPYPAGAVQIVRPANQGNDKYHLSFIRQGNSISGMGYVNNSNIFGIWVNSATGPQAVPDISFVNGTVGIGTYPSSSYKLAVEGTLGARRVKVTTAPWADYVFDDTYNLISLKELEAFIQKNKHLPDVPTTREVEKDGADVGDTQALLLKKIEELTLYVIEQNKKIEAQQQKIEVLESKLK